MHQQQPATASNCCMCVVDAVQGSKTAPNIVGEWQAAKESTEQTMKLMQMYKDLGDFEGQVRCSSSSNSSSTPVAAAALAAATTAAARRGAGCANAEQLLLARETEGACCQRQRGRHRQQVAGMSGAACRGTGCNAAGCCKTAAQTSADMAAVHQQSSNMLTLPTVLAPFLTRVIQMHAMRHHSRTSSSTTRAPLRTWTSPSPTSRSLASSQVRYLLMQQRSRQCRHGG
jgi:hypothetical protein